MEHLQKSSAGQSRARRDLNSVISWELESIGSIAQLMFNGN